ncbi:unnamed protein product [Rotaria sp. Silwood1]|nr:unnamed protein product [Rotaria sp. Silwood1]CAF5099113.1 unnamed protein product [Rotaria sp. Silwood1]
MLTLKQTTVINNGGAILNVLSYDIGKFDLLCVYLNDVWGSPFAAIMLFPLISMNIGFLPTLSVYFVFVLIAILQTVFSRMAAKYRLESVRWADKRIRAINECLIGCETIKMYCWEKPFERLIYKLRYNECQYIGRANGLRAINFSLYFLSLPLATLTAFGSYYLWEKQRPPLTTPLIFTTMVQLVILRSILVNLLSMSIESISELLPASKRIDEFINLTVISESEMSKEKKSNVFNDGSIQFENASFTWNDISNQLIDINLHIEPGTFVGILGAIGAGKSSLLSAVLGEMRIVNGRRNRSQKKIAYVSEKPWLFTGTIRENILFGQILDHEKYRKVLEATCLIDDLNEFQAGDLTVIAENGTNLSGGQRARVNLARTLYGSDEADFVLLDDPLSAVDGQVARKIVDQCLLNYLKSKTRLLVTHRIHFLSHTDYCLLLENGRIKKINSFNELMLNEPEVRKIYEQQVLSDMKKKDVDENTDDNNFEISQLVDNKSIVQEEQSAIGQIQSKLWIILFTNAYGWIGFTIFLLLMILGQISFDCTNLWISLRTVPSQFGKQHMQFLFISLILTLTTVILSLVRAIVYTQLLISTSFKLHNQMFKSVLYTSLRFYESNPIGRILNRFSKDQQIIDELFPGIFFECLQGFLGAAGGLVILGIANVWVLLIVILTTPLFFYLYRYYLRTALQIKRLESITRSPVHALFSSTLNGLPTIRSSKSEKYVVEQFLTCLDRYARPSFEFETVSLWLALRIDLIINLFLILTMILGNNSSIIC